MNTIHTQQTLSGKAEDIYNKLMGPDGLLIWAMTPPGNVWRSAWAFDTLSDYCNLFDSSIADDLAKRMISEGLNPTSQGNWWDDFGWIGIAGLRASQMSNYNQTDRASFFKNAMNAWCYMYGSAWNKTTQPDPPNPLDFNVPFPDVVGWKTFLGNGTYGPQNQFHGKNHIDIGAPNVYNDVKGVHGMSTFEPKFSVGGAWNSPLEGADSSRMQSSSMASCGNPSEPNFLNPIQNTVTNGLFAILSNRVFVALNNGLWDELIGKDVHATEKTNIMNNAFTSAVNQITWFSDWFGAGTTNSNLSLKYDLNNGSLIRERAPAYKAVNTWDAAYCNQLAWTGDQGLLIATLRESVNLTEYAPSGWLTDDQKAQLNTAAAIYPKIIEAVHNYTVSQLNVAGLSHEFYRPWVQVATSVSGVESKIFSLFPQTDDGDYDTGIAVLCRYLLQAYKADNASLEPYLTMINDMADAIVAGKLDENQSFDCNGLFPDGATGSDAVTPWLNQLSILCLAKEIQNAN